MNRILLLLALCAVVLTVQANDLSVTLVDTIVAADTVDGAENYDSVYGATYVDLREYSYLDFYSRVIAPGEGYTAMNYTGDTFFVKFQISPNQVAWRTCEIDTFTQADSSWSVLSLTAADSLGLGNWGRVMFVHADTTEGDSPDSIDLVRAMKCELWLITGP